MSTEQKNYRPFYEQPEAYYPGYSGSFDTPQAGENSISHVSPASQPLLQQRGRITPMQCLILASISVGMMALFSMIVLTSTQNTLTGLIGIGIMCAAIVVVNLFFISASQHPSAPIKL